jgi:hypothetical protein
MSVREFPTLATRLLLKFQWPDTERDKQTIAMKKGTASKYFHFMEQL